LTSLFLLLACGGKNSQTEKQAVSSKKAITEFWLCGVSGVIDEIGKAITVKIPSGTSVTAAIASFTTTGAKVSIGSVTQTSGVTVNNFYRTAKNSYTPVIYIVTATDGSTVQYTVEIELEYIPAITSYSIDGTPGVINQQNKTISVAMPFGTVNLTAKIAAFVTIGTADPTAGAFIGSVLQISGAMVNDFTNPVIYTVVGAYGRSVQYTITVSIASSPAKAKAITGFSLNGKAGLINEIDKTIAVNMRSTADVSKLIATFTTTGTRVNVGDQQQLNGVTPNDFTDPVFYKVTAEDGTTVKYQVTALSQSLAYQINYAHSGHAIMVEPISFPDSPIWSVTFDGNLSYPLIAGGKVFILDSRSDWHNKANLYALDLATGSIIWGPVSVGSDTFSQTVGFAYDHGKIFVIDHDAWLKSFDANTGRLGWTRSITAPDILNTYSTPVAVNGIIYLSSSGVGTTVYAINEFDGSVLWTQPVSGGNWGSPTVSHNGVFISYPAEIYKFDPLTGFLLWRYWAGNGGGGLTSAYANGLLYARDHVEAFKKGYLTFDAETGEIIDAIPLWLAPHATIPALTDKTKYTVIDGTLQAVDLNSDELIWSFIGDGNLVSAPIVLNQYVIVGSTSGLVYALDGSNGKQIWSANAGAPIIEPFMNEQEIKPLTGLGAGEGCLIVPASNVLTAWRVGL
jgi:outer membrane protein assembly factor BamB